MHKVTVLESGYDFITLYFKTHNEMALAAKKLYSFMKRVEFKQLDLQRKNLVHKPGDVPHFHNGIDATKGPHFHIIYSRRPNQRDWKILNRMLKSKLVQIDLSKEIEHEEIC